MSKEHKETPQPTPATTLPRPRSKRGIRGFFAEVGREMKKVHWPKPAETNRLTGVVLTVCTLLTLILFLFSTASHEVVRVLTQGF
ncbi:MAG: preprotein translocase subunit SecE [Fimbriimonadaceae bacterium]